MHAIACVCILYNMHAITIHLCSNALLYALAMQYSCTYACLVRHKQFKQLCTTKLTELCSNAIW